LYSSTLRKQYSRKLENKWLGLDRIRDLRRDRGTFYLNEMDETEFKLPYPRERLQKFYLRRGVDSEKYEQELAGEEKAEEKLDE